MSRWSNTLVLLLLFFSPLALAYTQPLPQSVAQEVLSESLDTGFIVSDILRPMDLSVKDFSVEWIGAPIPGVRFALGENSLEWVRIVDVLVVPRARLLVSAEGFEGGHANHAGFLSPFITRTGAGKAAVDAAFPVAMLSGEKNSIDLTFLKNGQEVKGRLQIRFKPRSKSTKPRMIADTSCSPYGVQVSQMSKADTNDQSWGYIGCRMIHVRGSQYQTSSLEVLMVIDNAGQSVRVGGVETPSVSPSLWTFRFKSSPAPVLFKAGAQEFALRYFIPEKDHFAFIGVGVGPYLYTVNAPEGNLQTVAPILTLYGSYFLSETFRLVAFDATSLNGQFLTDFGVYTSSEYFRLLDRRVTINLMLGGHAAVFKANGTSNFKMSLPQGFEILFRDFGAASYNLAMGSFLYPTISDTSYYNVWLRWGARGYFGEFNYIGIGEPIGTQRYYSRSLGFTFGFPLFKFL